MRKLGLLAGMVAMTSLLAGPAWSEQDGKGGLHEQARPQSLQEAKDRAQKRLDRLNKMTPEEWEAKQKRRQEGKEKWKAMTPEERAKKKAEWKEKRGEKRPSSGEHASPPGQ